MVKNNKNDKKHEHFGDIVENHNLVKRTLMVSAFPALIKEVKKEDGTFFAGFLPGFDFTEINDFESEDEIVETLQDMLDDEVEELVVFGKSLPELPDDEELLKKNPEYKIIYLDINVWADKEELDYYDECTHDCSSCSGHCHDEEFDEFEEDCCDDNCGCDDDDCDCCDDDCDCDDENCGHKK